MQLTDPDPSVTVEQFAQEFMHCSMCEGCREDPTGFSNDMRIFNLADESMIREQCHMAFQSGDYGDCRYTANLLSTTFEFKRWFNGFVIGLDVIKTFLILSNVTRKSTVTVLTVRLSTFLNIS